MGKTKQQQKSNEIHYSSTPWTYIGSPN